MEIEGDPFPDFAMPKIQLRDLHYPEAGHRVFSGDDDDDKREMNRGKSAEQVAPRRKNPKNRVAPPPVLVHLLKEQKICENLVKELKMADESTLAQQLEIGQYHPGSSVRRELASIMAETSHTMSRIKEEIRVVRLGLSDPAKTGATRTKSDTEEETGRWEAGDHGADG